MTLKTGPRWNRYSPTSGFVNGTTSNAKAHLRSELEETAFNNGHLKVYLNFIISGVTQVRIV